MGNPDLERSAAVERMRSSATTTPTVNKLMGTGDQINAIAHYKPSASLIVNEPNNVVNNSAVVTGRSAHGAAINDVAPVSMIPSQLPREAREALKMYRQRQWENYAAANNLETTPGAMIRNGTMKTRDGRQYAYYNNQWNEIEKDPYAVDVKALTPEEKARYRKMSAAERERWAFDRGYQNNVALNNVPKDGVKQLEGQLSEVQEKAYKEYAAKRAAQRQALLNAKRYEDDYISTGQIMRQKAQNWMSGFLSDRDTKHIISAVRPQYGC